MQIFALDNDPVQAARWHSNVHVNKMLIESCQLLSSAHWTTGGTAPYKLTHQNHPCAKWVRQSLSNYKWLCTLAVTLEEEYNQRRFLQGKPEREHGCHKAVVHLTANFPNIPDVGVTPFAVAVKDDVLQKCLVPNDVVATYRNFYNTKRSGKHAVWTQNKPSWWVE